MVSVMLSFHVLFRPRWSDAGNSKNYNKVWKNNDLEEEEKVGANAGTDHDKTVLNKDWGTAKGIEVGLTGRLVLDESDDANVDHQQSCGHEQLGPSVMRASRDVDTL